MSKRSEEKRTYWRGMLERRAASGLSVRQFCREEQVSEALFHSWKRRLAHASPSSACLLAAWIHPLLTWPLSPIGAQELGGERASGNLRPDTLPGQPARILRGDDGNLVDYCLC